MTETELAPSSSSDYYFLITSTKWKLMGDHNDNNY